jgi:aldehyde dehydrogenase (NAD+)
MTTTDSGATQGVMTVLPQRDALGVGHGRCYIDGRWTDGSEGVTWTHVHPATNEEVATFAVASAADVDRAVRSARVAFDEGPWPRMQARDRRRLLQRVAQLLGENIDELNRIQALDNGIPVEFTSIYQLSAEMAADVFDYHAGWVDRIAGQTLPDYEGQRFQTLTLREPVGVVGAIIPWNAPLMLFAQKVAPALAAGCTVVLKPSEYATLVTLRMTELMIEAGVPEGVFHLVLGPGDPTGETLVTHPATDKITFTGSRAVGRRIMAAGADRVARLSLELGGKSPNIIFPDVDLDTVSMTAMGMVSMGLSGQGCVCHTRALVHESIYDEFLQKAEAFIPMVNMGNPFDSGINAGPIINERQLERILGMIDAAGSDGARLVAGGKRANGDLAQGNFVQPTLFADVDNSMTIAREEVFGPVLAAIPFRDEEHAIALANDTDYGLGASVQTHDVGRAIRVAKAVRSGTFGVNGYTVSPHAPFGGYKTSGLGREGGHEGIDEFLETKTVTIAL